MSVVRRISPPHLPARLGRPRIGVAGEEAGVIGQAAASHYSFMGYILEPQVLLEETVPEIVGYLEEDGVDAVLLVPA